MIIKIFEKVHYIDPVWGIAIFCFMMWAVTMICLHRRHKEIFQLREEVKFLRGNGE